MAGVVIAGQQGQSACMTQATSVLMAGCQVKTAWSENLTKNGWGLTVCFRAKYRRTYHREPTMEEEDHWRDLIDAKIESVADWKVDPQWIKEDMDAGKEVHFFTLNANSKDQLLTIIVAPDCRSPKVCWIRCRFSTSDCSRRRRLRSAS